jgi:hypothetical protein
MTYWVDRYRESVSWGDQIHADLVPLTGEQCCWFTHSGGRQYMTPGFLGPQLAESLARAQRCRIATGTPTAVLFLDEEATSYQVEEAAYTLCQAGLGCGFLEPQPQVKYLMHLERASEGTLVDLLESAADQWRRAGD